MYLFDISSRSILIFQEEKVAGLNAKVGDEVDDENGDANMNLQTSKGDEGIEEDDADGAEEMNATELLEEIHEALASTKGQISNELTCRWRFTHCTAKFLFLIKKVTADFVFMFRLLKKRLTMSPCINQGYVLDGFPETRAQAKGLLEGNWFSSHNNHKGYSNNILTFLKWISLSLSHWRCLDEIKIYNRDFRMKYLFSHHAKMLLFLKKRFFVYRAFFINTRTCDVSCVKYQLGHTN